ncbi:PLDc N-terminal domain-containing protein [Rariglobus hedericola]|uniref:Uncharacterized protein n=1 Tax=Rariglobus hedericola TaxID=2597822 RepID=A0A556QR60_9BACT|nr:PLDc N-terminal domain-containing protein [Rariglobus hedericola]TSJ79121.1 hypothetical protein FPL22_07460 [Rariglobus hedericola]
MEFFGIYSLPTALEVALKIFCIVHVIRNDRSYLWIMLILFLPFFGSAIYFCMEILPGLKTGGRRGGASFKVPQTSARTISKMREQLEFSNTTQNRTRLAQALASAKRFPEALDTLNDCLQGVFKDDPLLTYERAQVYFAAGRYDEALADLTRLDELRSRHAAPARFLLAARCHEALGDETLALRTYEEAVSVGSGEEARSRYAQLLNKTGRTDEAGRLFREIISHAKHGDRHYRRLNGEWIKVAKAHVAKV